ncbi:MAG TPA: hypothetical protein VLD61_04620 [Methylomirabilota bacterium]|nr:hypothetical protein [Methylomirabilota bacterium]
MMTRLAVLATMLTPILVVGSLLWLAGRRDRRREAMVARQIRLSDAIAAELGAIVAPVVRKRWGGPWEVRIAVPLDRPRVVARILEVTRTVLEGIVMPGGYELVLTAQESARPGNAGSCPARTAALARLRVA